MTEDNYETGSETKELTIKIFDFFYIPDEDESIYEELTDSLESLTQTKKDAENVFGQIFEFLQDEELDLQRIKKIFLLTYKILKSSSKGDRIFKTVIGENCKHYDSFYEKHKSMLILGGYTAITKLYSNLTQLFDQYKTKSKENISNVDIPRKSVSMRRSIIKVGADLEKLLKQAENTENTENPGNTNIISKKSIIEKFSAELEKEISSPEETDEKNTIINTSENNDNFSNVNDSSNNTPTLTHNITTNTRISINTNKDEDFREKKNSAVSGGLLDFDLAEVKERQDIFQNNLENLLSIDNSFSSDNRQHRIQTLGQLSLKNLITSVNYSDEKEIENQNIIYYIHKQTGEKEINYISINLLFKYLTTFSPIEIFRFDISKAMAIQHNGIISSDDLIIFLNSFLAKEPKSRETILSFLTSWVFYQYRDEFLNDENLRSKVVKLFNSINLENTLLDKKKIKISELIKILSAASCEEQETLLRTFKSNNFGSVSSVVLETPIIPNQREYFLIFDWSEVELARQLTLITSYIFNKIQVRELLNAKWTKLDKHQNAPNVTQMIARFNNLSLWICEEILAFDKAKHRASAIEQFINLGMELKRIQNFNDCFMVVTALNSFNIKSLTKSWTRISFEAVKKFKELNNFCSYTKNYSALREEMDKAEGPCVPYLGYFLKELAFIDEGPKYTKEPILVNIEKLRKVSKVLDEIHKFQSQNYNFKPVYNLCFLADTFPKNEEELTQISSKLEPSFTLCKSKSPIKRLTNTDLKINNLSQNFSLFIESQNKIKTVMSLRDRIKMHFNQP